MKKTDLIIFGCGKVADILMDAITGEPNPGFVPAGFCVDAAHYAQAQYNGLPVVKAEEVAQHFPPGRYKMLVAIGYHQMNAVRAARVADMRARGYTLVSYVHPAAFVAASATIGENCIILDNVSIGAHAELGDNVCLYPGATVAHHAKVGDNTWVTAGTTIGGSTVIGKNGFLGLNSTIGHNISIGNDNFIGAGAVLTRSTRDKEVHIIPDTPKHRLDTDQFLKLFRFD
jgi:sugar O-acyltransferase (sialic acid O-acetyltransferase NeuD family)